MLEREIARLVGVVMRVLDPNEPARELKVDVRELHEVLQLTTEFPPITGAATDACSV